VLSKRWNSEPWPRKGLRWRRKEGANWWKASEWRSDAKPRIVNHVKTSASLAVRRICKAKQRMVQVAVNLQVSGCRPKNMSRWCIATASPGPLLQVSDRAEQPCEKGLTAIVDKPRENCHWLLSLWH
jgi:hypothetical protein